MANLKDLLVNGVARVIGKVYAPEFVGKLTGNADTATKLGTATVGSTSQPIYLNGGIPTKISYTIGANVPTGAVFTDTTYSAATSSTLGLVKSTTTGTTSNRDYGVQVNSDGTMKVNVPWTDTKVTSEANNTTKAYLVGSTSPSTNTGTLIKDVNVYLDTTAGKLVASEFVGNLTGNANTATGDGSGNIIENTYATKTELNTALGDVETLLSNI